MKKSSALIFGNNEYGLEIAKNVVFKYKEITIFSLHQVESVVDGSSEFAVEKFDLSDNWDDLKNEYDMESSIIFCALSDEAENIFLTISLRSSFEHITIIALAKNNEDANKLKMAGASKVIPIVETTANIITDMLRKPIITNVLHDILYENSTLKVEQIQVKNAKHFERKYPADIDWSRYKGVIVLSIIQEDMSSAFVYSAKAKHHVIEDGDVLVVVGFDADIQEFKRIIGNYDG